MWVAGPVRAAGPGMVLFALALGACGPSDAPFVPEPVEQEPLEARPLSQHADARAPRVAAAAYEPGCVTLKAPALEPTEVGASAMSTAVLRNACSVPVTLFGFNLLDLSGSSECCGYPEYCPEFFLVAHDPIPARGLTLQPGASTTVKFTYQPRDLAGPDRVWLTANLSHDQAPIVAELLVTGTAVPQEPVVESFTKTPWYRTDLLLVVDTSPSMIPRMTDVREGIRAIIKNLDWLHGRARDLHVGVVAADDPGEGLVPHPESGARYFTERTPELATRLDETIASVVGSGSGASQPLAAAVAAVHSPRSLHPSANAGFSRPEANLSVLILTDQPDRSPESVNGLLAQLRASRDEQRESFVAVVGPFTEGCGVMRRWTLGPSSDADARMGLAVHLRSGLGGTAPSARKDDEFVDGHILSGLHPDGGELGGRAGVAGRRGDSACAGGMELRTLRQLTQPAGHLGLAVGRQLPRHIPPQGLLVVGRFRRRPDVGSRDVGSGTSRLQVQRT